MFKTILRIKYNKIAETIKICEDIVKTSENKGEDFVYTIDGNNLIIYSDSKKRALARKYWFLHNTDKVIFGVVKDE